MTIVEQQAVSGPRAHRNSDKLIKYGDAAWRVAKDNGLIGIVADHRSNNELRVPGTGHEFTVLCSCSYLGLNRHPKILEGAIDALRTVGTTGLGLAEARVRLSILKQFEDEAADLFGAPVLPGVSCSALTAGILPLLGSGHLTDGEPMVMVFDKLCHFSMAYAKPICADETLVLTAPHNDLDFLEDVCKKYRRVAYVADGAYSMGGLTALKGLRDLQDRYGLFLYFDDSHSLSLHGTHGQGYIRTQMDLNPRTMVVASLAKAFGTAGGIAMLGDRPMFDFLYRNAGPVVWSQNMEVAAIGASLASVALHRTAELGELQRALQRNIAIFDGHFPTEHAGDGQPIRKITVGSEEVAVALSRRLYEAGYYCSAVFFPIVARGEAGIRIMMRADLTAEQVEAFCRTARGILDEYEYTA